MPLTEYMKKRHYPPKAFEPIAWIRKSPRALQVLDAIVTTTPPISVSKIAEKTGIPRQQIHKHLRKIACGEDVYVMTAYALHAIGLGTIAVIMDGWPPQDILLKLKEARDMYLSLVRKAKDVTIVERYNRILRKLIPQYYWNYTVIALAPETFLTYRYPFTYGYDFILKDLEKRGKVVQYFNFTHRYIPINKYGDYWLGKDFADPFEALKITLENPSSFKQCIPTQINEGPHDIYDLYLLTMLELNALLRTRDMASYFKRKFQLGKPTHRVRTHLNHLIRNGIIYGANIFIPCFNAYWSGDGCSYTVFGYLNGSSLWDFADFFVRYPFRGSFLINTEDDAAMLTLLVSSWNDLLKILEFLREHFGFEYLTSILVRNMASLTLSTIPYRNFDPVRREWVVDEGELDRLDELLRRRGFDDEVVWLTPRDVYCRG